MALALGERRDQAAADVTEVLSSGTRSSVAPFTEQPTLVQNLKALPTVLGDTLFTNEGWKRTRRRTSADQALDRLLGDVMTRETSAPKLVNARTSLFSAHSTITECESRRAVDETNFSIFAEDGDLTSFPVIRFLSPFAVFVDRLRMLFALWTLLYTPLMMAFHRLPSFSWRLPVAYAVDTIADSVFLVGTLLALVTTVASSKAGREYVASHMIWRRRMRSPLFWCDALSCVPFLVGIFTGEVSPSSTSRLTVQSLKLLRIHWVIFMPASHFETGFHSLLQVARMFVWIVLSMHLMACMWYAVVVANGTEERHLEGLSEVTEITHYLIAVKNGAYLVSGKPTDSYSDDEMLIVAIASPMFGIFFAFIFGNTTMLLTRMNILMSKHHKHVALIQSTMRSLDIPAELRHRITRYHHFLAVHHNINAYKLLMQGLSVNLFLELKAHLFRKMFSEGKFFRDAPGGFLRRLLQVMVEATFCPGDIVVRCGDLGDQMYFVVKGKLDVLSPQGAVIGKISENQYFGEIALLISTPRLVSIRATTYCLLAMISRDKFLPILESHPEQKQSMYDSMALYKYSGGGTSGAEGEEETDDRGASKSPSAASLEHVEEDDFSIDAAGCSRNSVASSSARVCSFVQERASSPEPVGDSSDARDDAKDWVHESHSLPLNSQGSSASLVLSGVRDNKKQILRRKSTSFLPREGSTQDHRVRPRAGTLPRLAQNAHQVSGSQMLGRQRSGVSHNTGRRESTLSVLSAQFCNQLIGTSTKKARFNCGRTSLVGLGSWLTSNSPPSSKASPSDHSRTRRVSVRDTKMVNMEHSRNRRESCHTAISRDSEGNSIVQGVLPSRDSSVSLIGLPATGTILRPHAAQQSNTEPANGSLLRDSAKWALVGDLVVDRLDELDADLSKSMQEMEERIVRRLGDRYEQPLQKIEQQVRRLEDVFSRFMAGGYMARDFAGGSKGGSKDRAVVIESEIIEESAAATSTLPGVIQ